MKIVFNAEKTFRDFTTTEEDISYAIGVALRARAEQNPYQKIPAIKYLRMEKGYGLYEAKTLIEFAVEMIKQCEGNKLPAALNPID